MERRRISVIVSADGSVEARSWSDDARISTAGHRLDLTGLDGRTLRLFDRWLRKRDRTWSEEELRVFGLLLHRRLFSSDVWAWLLDRFDAARADGVVIELSLVFQADAASSRMAALPWEYLCSPDRPGRDGQFLVLTAGLMLSRSVPPGTAHQPNPDANRVRILPVVGEHGDETLGRVEYEEVEDSLRVAAAACDFDVLDTCVDATLEQLAGLVRERRPHVLHYLGHARFDDLDGLGSVALHDPQGGYRWVDENRLAAAVCSESWAPTVTILHACEGGANDYDFRYAGLAPALVRSGVQSVVAMQYPVLNSTASTFSTALYEALADHQYLDEAVQSARRITWESVPDDARPLGLPMLYHRSARPLIGAAAGQETAR
ncbi:CHAT domain-containing protein [Nocardioides sp.]|uniref:CHAT domain-containing protein n=1 Tax=Nocardioides sp. TaxID=35761 RepID=UPI002ED35539